MLRFLPSDAVVAFTVITSLIGFGCADLDGNPGGFSVRDSANIRVAESAAPALGPDDVWTVSDEPILQIGKAEGEEPYLFSRIRSVFRINGNRIVVCDGTTRTIRLFSSSGEFLWETGGSGDGPGEFRMLVGCHRFSDGFAGVDRGSTQLFGSDGSFMASVSFPSLGNGLPYGLGVFSDGSALLLSNSRDRTPGLNLESANAFHLSHEGLVIDSLIGVPYARRVVGPEMSYSQAFGPQAQFLPAGGKLFFGWPQEYSIEVYDESWQLEKRIRRSWEPRSVSSEDREWWTSTLINGPMPGGGEPTPAALQARRRIAEIQIFPADHSAFDLLKMDTEGFLWVRRTHPRFEPSHFNPLENTSIQRIWDVFDLEGRWLTSVSPPVDLEIHDIGRDYIMGIWRDDLGIEYVRVHSLGRTGIGDEEQP